MTTTPAPSRRAGLATLLPYLRAHRRAIAAVVTLTFTASAGSLAQPLLIRSMLADLSAGVPVTGLVAALAALLAGVVLVQALRNFLLQRAAEGVVLATRRRLIDHLVRLPIGEYDRRRKGDLLSRVGADTLVLRTAITSGMLELATGGFLMAGAVIMMIIVDPLMFGVTMAALSALTIGIMVARRVRGVSEHAQACIGEMTSAVERALTGVRTIRAARAEAREAAVVIDRAEAAYRAGVRMARLQAALGPTVIAAAQGGLLAVLGVGGARVAAGTMAVGDLVAFVLFLFLLMMPIGQAMNAYAQMQAALGALQRIEDVLALPDESAGGDPAAVAVPRADPPTGRFITATVPPATKNGSSAIAFEGVSFGYPSGPLILREVSFEVPAGTRTALVGPSGAGKSTLLSLVERFYDVTAGAVLLGGVDIRDQNRAQVRAQLGYVEQEAPVLAGTFRENLLLAAPDASEERLWAALAEANLAQFVSRTPEGLDAQVGEGGVLLSGGERQRLALARVLLTGAPILLLDEPTSNLDARNEHALRQAVAAAAASRTLLIVAHRLATVVDADQIVLLEQGRVAAIGQHRELTQTNKLYYELASHQLLI